MSMNSDCQFINIILFSATFVLQNEKLVRDRLHSHCGLITGKDGLPVVAIIGGQESGMEIWNPRLKTVELLWDAIPPEEGGEYGKKFLVKTAKTFPKRFTLFKNLLFLLFTKLFILCFSCFS